ncbi:hypothetical protein [Oceanivirga salmonicida]|uniref:hypothetical protein n=1 Tax=Oceanivirga salmonicida TaxID=1769291 RepID=UPI00083334A6|nr:hypothetical protein [Oceanivirga salmonicida]
MLNVKKILIAVFLSTSFFSCSVLYYSQKALNDKHVAIKQYNEEPKLVYKDIPFDYVLYTNYDAEMKTLKIAKINENQIYTKYKDKYRVMDLVDQKNNGYVDKNREIFISIINEKAFLMEKENTKKMIKFEEIIK